jgi:pilus assembly protein FimV
MTMQQFKRHGVQVAMGLSLMAMCGASQGLGLGQGGSAVTMGEGLSFDAPLRLAPGERLDDDCLSADVYFGDDKQPGFKVAVSLSQDWHGAPAIHVATSSRVNEPVVTVYVAAGCLTHVTRKYVVLADPPGLPMPAVSPLAGDGSIATADAPVATHPRKRPGSAEGRSGSGHSGRGLALARHGGARSSALASALRSHLKPPPLSAAARLQIDPVAADALVAPILRMGTTLSMPTDWALDSPAVRARRAAATAYWRALQAVPENWAQDQARLADLERRVVALQSLRDQMASARQASAVAPAASSASPRFARNEDEVQRIRIVGLIGVALFGLVAWGRMRWRDRDAGVDLRQNWWQGWLEGGRAAAADLGKVSREEVLPTTLPSSHGAQALGQLAKAPPIASDVVAERPGQGTTMDELIDLTQQVDLFVVLGQDDAAQALLEDHVQQEVGGSPLPFLLLLALQHRRNQRPGYERTRQAFEARFNGQAPSWAHAAHLQGRSLADMPTIWREVQSARMQAEQEARSLLAQLVCKPPESGADRLGLLAYKDLLSAYNELAQTAAAGRDADITVRAAPGVQTRPAAAHRAQAETGGIALSC